MFDLDLNIILAFIFGLMVLYLLARVLVYPMRVLAKAAGHFLVGVALLILFNLVGGLVGLGLGVNILSALVVGFLGVPGLLTLLIIQRILS